MVTARRVGEAYCVEVSNGARLVRVDTVKKGIVGNAGMRPHELLKSALAGCICMSIDMAAERASAVLLEVFVEVRIDRLEHETGFDVSLAFGAPLSPLLSN